MRHPDLLAFIAVFALGALALLVAFVASMLEFFHRKGRAAARNLHVRFQSNDKGVSASTESGTTDCNTPFNDNQQDAATA